MLKDFACGRASFPVSFDSTFGRIWKCARTQTSMDCYVPAICPFVAVVPSTPVTLPDVPAFVDSTVVLESWVPVISDSIVMTGQSKVAI